jgi:hypothetical protein
MGPTTVLVVPTKDVSYTLLVSNDILWVPVHMKKNTLKLISIPFYFLFNMSFYSYSTTLDSEP